MLMWYKIYIGDFHTKEGLPAAPSLYSKCPKSAVKKLTAEAAGKIKQGLDVYIVNPKGEVKAFYKDNLGKLWGGKCTE